MNLEEKRDVARERGERQVQEREAAGIDKHRTERVDASRKVILRRATFGDLNAIIDINVNVYSGCDYIPTLFYIFMQSKQHIIYVYEEDGKLISLVNVAIAADSDDLIRVMSGRVRPSKEGRGYALTPTSQGFAQLLKEHPKIRRFVIDVFFTPERAAKLQNVKVNYYWNLLVYRPADSQRLSRSASLRQTTFDANRPFSPSYAMATEWLERSDQLARFLSKYVSDLFPCGTIWLPTPVNKSGLRHMFLSTNVYVSIDGISPIGNNHSTELIPDNGFIPIGKTDTGRGSELVGLSYSSVCPCKHGIRIDIFFYGDSEQVFLSHVYSQLYHYINLTSKDARFAILLNFPLSIDYKNMDELLREDLEEKFLDIGAPQALQYMSDFPQAKL